MNAKVVLQNNVQYSVVREKVQSKMVKKIAKRYSIWQTDKSVDLK